MSEVPPSPYGLTNFDLHAKPKPKTNPVTLTKEEFYSKMLELSGKHLDVFIEGKSAEASFSLDSVEISPPPSETGAPLSVALISCSRLRCDITFNLCNAESIQQVDDKTYYLVDENGHGTYYRLAVVKDKFED